MKCSNEIVLRHNIKQNQGQLHYHAVNVQKLNFLFLEHICRVTEVGHSSFPHPSSDVNPPWIAVNHQSMNLLWLSVFTHLLKDYSTLCISLIIAVFIRSAQCIGGSRASASSIKQMPIIGFQICSCGSEVMVETHVWRCTVTALTWNGEFRVSKLS